jgi:ClpP class serine protease
MEEVAQGRVWTGKDADSRGLVDAIGGISRAIAIAKLKANIPQDRQVCCLPFFYLQFFTLVLNLVRMNTSHTYIYKSRVLMSEVLKIATRVHTF